MQTHLQGTHLLRHAGIRQRSAEFFTGFVRIGMLNDPLPPARASCASVTLEPMARSVWHIHPLGPILIVTTACGWTQCEGEPIVGIRADDAIWCPPGYKRWYGTTAITAMTHIAVQEAFDGKNVEWLTHVTDTEFFVGVPATARAYG